MLFLENTFSQSRLLTKTEEFLNIQKSFEYFEDKKGEFKFKEIRLKKFKKYNDESNQFGFSSSTFWFRVTIKKTGPLDGSLILRIENPLIDQLTFYKKTKGVWKNFETGDSYLFKTRLMNDHNFSFPIETLKEKIVLYFKVKNSTGIIFPVKIYSKENFRKNIELENYFYGIFYGVILWIFFYNIYAYFNLRDYSLLPYSFYNLFFGLVTCVLNGVGFRFLFPNLPWVQNQGLYIFIGLSVLSFIFFMRRLLTSEKTFNSFVYLTYFLISLSLFLENLFRVLPYIFIPYIVIFTVLSLRFSFHKLKKNDEASRSLFIGILFFGIGLFITMLVFFGVFKNIFLLNNGVFLGGIIQIGILSIGKLQVLNQIRLEGETKALELENAKFDIQKKSEDLTSFSNLLMRSVEDLEMALDEVKEANKLKNNFLSNISHEIKTPLNAIMGFTEILKSAYTTEAQKNYLFSITESGNQLNRTLDNILDLSKIETGDFFLNKFPFEFNYIENKIIKKYSDLALEKGLDFNFIKKTDFSGVINVDPFRFEHIITAILSNALKFTKEGEIKVQIGFEGDDKKGDFTFEVQDTGVGISIENHQKIFRPFVKVKGHLHGGEGIGVGLSFVEAITKKMGGEVTLKSELNKGSTFSITIPNIHVIQSEEITKRIFIKNFNEEIICIIDENKFVMEKTKEMLENLNLKVLIFSNLEEFAGYINFSSADLVLIQRDLVFYTTFVHLKMFPLKDVPIIKLVMKPTRLNDSLYIYDSKESYYKKISKIIKRKNSQKEIFVPLENLKIVDKEGLNKKLEELKGEFKDVINLMDLKMIEEFSYKIKNLATEHNCKILAEWSTKIISDTERFDIKEIEKELIHYEELIRTLKS